MSEQDKMDGVPAVSAKWRAIALMAIVVLGLALIVAVFFAMKKPEPGRVTKVYEGEAAVVNTGAIMDGTDPMVRVTPQVGYRYRVFVEDESDDRASGIARLGGRATFIDGARRGQTCIVDVTRVQDRVVNANLVKVVSEISLPPKPPREPYKPLPGDRSAFVVDGAVLDVVISEASSKNPDTEGVAKVEGLVVFVEGATTMGERVNVRIVQRREKMAFAELTGEPAGEGPLGYSEGAPKRAAFVPRADDETAFVVKDAEFDVVISEASSKNPDTEGVARVKGLVIFVQGATTIGERVNIRVTDRRERMAFAELSGKPAGEGPLPYAAGGAARAPRPRYAPPADDATAFVVKDAEFDVVISEQSSKNPDTEGVARVKGLVIFVKGATTIGERVNIRIVDRLERMAFAELSGKPAGEGPLPYAAEGRRPARDREPRQGKAFVPREGDSAAHVTAGAELDVEIVEESVKNPGQEGIAKVNGLVVAVKGATTVGERVRIRVTDRKARIAFAEAIGPAPEAPAEAEASEAPAAE